MTVRLTKPPTSLSKTPEELGWLEQLALIVGASVSSGSTAQRPVAFLYEGRPFYDTTLDIPIWRNAANTDWIDASGSVV
jgi:hypothetical protein